MYDSVEKFCNDVKTMYPLYKYEEGILKFIHEERTYANTNGTFLESNRSYYENTIMGSAKDENTTTSFNYSMQTSSNLDEDLMDQGGMKTVIESSVNELQAKPLEGKFVGDILITPLTVVDFLGSYSAVFLSDPAILSGSSRLIDALDTKVASEKLTVKSLVNDDRLAAPMMITPDGFIAKDMTVFDKGVLKNFSISYYTELKTGHKRALNRGNIEVYPGDVKLEDMIKNTKEGIIVGRFSGGSPSSNGDFSGVAKNSYYVKDGVIQYPITETMISGNLYDLFNDIVDISEERVNYGLFITPTIRCNNVTISGK
jgi:PmbA protein